MVRISENLIRKRAEHNNLEISTLEEVSLHQQDIERIEYIDKWCRDLKILYLQSNLIPKIENVSKLKKLEYLNLALNNVEVIENLEGCESLKKLDLTVNFIGELTSIETLKDLPHFKDLYLTGNPCAQYEGYREYVIGTLKNLERLDGTEIEKSERILALQNYGVVRARIIQQQLAYRKTRAKQKAEAKEREENKGKKKKEKEPGFDGKWYTEINESDKSQEDKENIIEDQGENQDKNEDDEFWKEEVAFTPESRIEVHNHMKKQREKENKKNEEPTQKPRRMFTEDGRPLNVNEAKIDFTLQDDEENNQLILDIACFKHMDTSLIDADVQTNYIRVTLKGKVFQLCLDCDVKPDSSSAKRSQTTGHLLITMPKANPLLKPPSKPSKTCETKKKKDEEKRNKGEEKLEVDPKAKKSVDIANIVQEKDLQPKIPLLGTKTRHQIKERPNSDNFIDNDDVPPLI